MEIGAVRFTPDGEILERFSTFVALDRALPLEIRRLTGIRDEDLAGAPALAEAVARLAAFVGDAWVVGHNIGFDLAFLEAAGLPTRERALDTAELASLLRPRAASYALQRLAADIGRETPRAHRALDDAEAAASLCAVLIREASALRLATLEAAQPLAAALGEPVAWFFARALSDRARRTFSAAPQQRQAPAITTRGSVPPRDLPTRAIFAADGPLAEAFGTAYEARPQQVVMAEAVERVIADGGVLLVEAGTGIGKSLAYLVPAARAARDGQRVLVSTYTTTLQDQLVLKDIPRLLAALGLELQVAVLKGRRNYLCPRRAQLLLASIATREEARLALKTLVWRETTETGDRAELNLFPGEAAAWGRFSAEDETCTPYRCATVREGCYLERAREAAERADIVVVNHALLLADARARHRLLPNARVVVVDEAHHLEEVAAAIWAARVDADELRPMLRRAAHGPFLNAAAREGMDETVARLRQEAERAEAAVTETAAALARLVPPPEERGFEDRRRVTAALRGSEEWLAVEVAAERLRDALLGTVRGAEALLAGAATDAEGQDAAADLDAAAAQLREAEAAIARAAHSPLPGDVCWVELGDAAATLRCAPAHAGPLVARSVVAPRAAAIFTSATLAVGESFAFAADRLGLDDRAATLRLDSPFDYRRAALLVLPLNLVDPYDPAFVDQAADVIADVARSLGGRTLALFTAHTMLREVHARLAGRLEGTSLVALAQNVGGSRRALLERFALGDAVLLGTASFWEGIDLPGDVLRCVVVVKLPFPVPDDPVVAGRAERYEDPFREYHVPVAALRLKQGFGRLIRTREDRGAVVLLDRRVGLRSYGEILLAALPSCAVERPDVDAVGAAVAAWCGGERA